MRAPGRELRKYEVVDLEAPADHNPAHQRVMRFDPYHPRLPAFGGDTSLGTNTVRVVPVRVMERGAIANCTVDLGCALGVALGIDVRLE